MYYEIYERYEAIRKQSGNKDARKVVCDEYGLSDEDLNEILNESEDFELTG